MKLFFIAVALVVATVTAKSTSKPLKVKLEVQFVAIPKPAAKPYQVSVPPASTAFQALLKGNNFPCHEIKYTIHEKYGVFIDSVCGVENDKKNSNYWFFYVNNVLANVGVSSYTLKDGDVIKMSYEKYVPNTGGH